MENCWRIQGSNIHYRIFCWAKDCTSFSCNWVFFKFLLLLFLVDYGTLSTLGLNQFFQELTKNTQAQHVRPNSSLVRGQLNLQRRIMALVFGLSLQNFLPNPKSNASSGGLLKCAHGGGAWRLSLPRSRGEKFPSIAQTNVNPLMFFF